MINKSRLLALVTARGGSRRLPKKNLAMLSGKPLIVWSIKAAMESSHVDRVIVSTENDEIAAVAQEAGAEVPFQRPTNLATDSASSTDVVEHALRELEKHGDRYGFVLLLQPTSPLRNSDHIDQAVALLQSKNADGVIGVTEVDHPAEWSNTLPDCLSMDGFSGKEFHARSQEFPVRYRVNGAIYLSRVKRLMEEKTFFFPSNVFAYKMNRSVSVDIDTSLDLKLAEILHREQQISNL